METNTVRHCGLAVRRPKIVTRIAVAIFKDEIRGDHDAAYDLNRSRRIRLHVIEHFHGVFEDHADLARFQTGKLSRILLEGPQFNSYRPKIFVGRGSCDRSDLFAFEVLEGLDALRIALSRRERGAIPPGRAREGYDFQAVRRLVNV